MRGKKKSKPKFSSPVEALRRFYPRPTVHELNQTLQDGYTGVLVVREPFERLVSCYRNKVEGKHPYYEPLRRKITTLYHEDQQAKYRVPRFSDFVQYVIDSSKNGWDFDEHYAPYYKFCTPCYYNISIIAKTETMWEDAEYIFTTVGLPRKVGLQQFNHNVKGGDTEDLVEQYFKTLSAKQILDLLDLYKPDFMIFDYDYSRYLKWADGNDSQIKR